MIGAILYRQIWNKLNLTRKLQDFQQAGKTRHDLAEAIFYMTVARSLMPDSRASEILCPWDNRSPPNGCIQ